MKLLKWNKDWGDEFDMSGFVVVTDDEYDEFKIQLGKISYPIESYFGTNEWYEFEDANDIEDGFDVTEISEEDVKILLKCFGSSYSDVVYFGYTPWDSIMESE